MTPLSAREVEILALVARGWPDKDIGRALGMTTNYARQTANSIAHKLGCRSRTQATVVAFATGLVSLEATYAAMSREMEVERA